MQLPAWLATISVAVSLAVTGCEYEPEPALPRNLLLISIDTLRPDRLGAHGYQRDTSPFLDEIAANGVLFENAYSPGSWTVPGHGSMFTGLYPRVHGLRYSMSQLKGGVSTLTQMLAARGFASFGVGNIFYITNKLGDDFEEFIEVAPSGGGVGATPQIGFLALDWLRRRDDRPFFMFLHFYDVHTPYAPLPYYRDSFAGAYEGKADGSPAILKAHRQGKIELDATDAAHLSDLYDAGIRQFDAALSELFASLEAKGILEDTLVILTSDHGEEFLEHGGFLHGRTLHEELVRIPLILYGAGVPKGLRVFEPVSLVDVVPTALSLLGLEVPPKLDGVDLSVAWRAEDHELPERTLYFEADEWAGRPDWGFRRAILSKGKKLHLEGLTGEHELFDLAEDPGERTDRAADQPDEARALRETLDAFVAAQPKGDILRPLPPARVRELRALGYLE